MFFSPRAKLKQLMGLCHRLGLSLEAGIDVRKVFAREAEQATGAMRRHLTSISHAIDRGSSLSKAFQLTDDYFPPLLHEMIAVGENTGELDSVLKQLAKHYEEQLSARRQFIGTIIWPMMQLGTCVVFIGVVIWLVGIFGLKNDPFGFGLVGEKGLRTYVQTVVILAFGIWIFVRALNRGVVWVGPVQRLALRLPLLGQALQTFALSRLAWTLQVTMSTGMSVRRALELSLRSTQNAHYIGQIRTIDAEIVAGNSIHEAFEIAGGYPLEFLDTIAVGEEGGKLAESLGHLARQYQERARMAMNAMARIAGGTVWAIIATSIIIMIFRVATSYVGAINDAARMR